MNKMSASISMEDISFSYGSKKVLEHFNLKIDTGRIYALIGSSGSGKTTTLRLMNGLLEPESGSIYIDGKNFDFNNSEKWRRSMGYSIQGAGLFPHMTIEENLSIIAHKEGWGSKKIKARIDELCHLVNLPNDKSFLQKKPRLLSGGQQQRIGIARALFMSPNIILMDEPFSALDPITRSEIQKEFLSLQKKLSLTIVLVTHDLPEAFTMADEIILLNDGRIEQKAKPSRFLLSPETDYVKRFMESHSPGNLLKEIYLYSVINTDIYVATQINNAISVRNLDTHDEKDLNSLNDLKEFLSTQNQDNIFWIDENGKLISSQYFDSKTIYPESHENLKSTDNILNGMKKIISSDVTAIPVVNHENKVMGVFSRGALDAL